MVRQVLNIKFAALVFRPDYNVKKNCRLLEKTYFKIQTYGCQESSIAPAPVCFGILVYNI